MTREECMLLSSDDAEVDGRVIPALPTRDALLPLLCALVASRKAGLPLSVLVERVGAKPAASHRLQNVPGEKSAAFLARLSEDEGFRCGFFVWTQSGSRAGTGTDGETSGPQGSFFPSKSLTHRLYASRWRRHAHCLVSGSRKRSDRRDLGRREAQACRGDG